MRRFRFQQGCFAAAGAAALLYALTLSRSVGAGDSGELILAARGLGIAHPPGYALWLLLARLAAAVPAGALALRVNAVSAFATAVATGLFWLVSRRAGLRPPAAAVATVLFATAPVLWASAVEAEVYGLAIAGFLALALLAARARAARGTGRDEALFFFAAGLATVLHQTLLFPALAFAAWVLARRGAGAPRTARAIGWAVLGFSLTLVIPVRWSAGPSFAWTDVNGLSGLADFLLRRTYGGLAQNPFRLDRAFDEATGMSGIAIASLGWLGAALAATGLFARRARRAAGALALAAASIPAALIALIAFTPDAEHLAQVTPFLAPLVAAGALFAGAGAQSVAGFAARLRARRDAPLGGALRSAELRRALASAALVGAALALVPGRYAAADRSRFTLAERYGRDLLAEAPRGATLVLDGDNETFLAAYASRVEGRRPDVTLRHRRGWIFGDPCGLRSKPRAEWTSAAHQDEMERIRRGTETLCYAVPPADLIRAGVSFRQRGLVYAAAPAGSAVPGWDPPAGWPRSSDLLEGHPERYDYVTRKMAVSYSDAAARRLWARGQVAEALPWFLDAARVGYDFPGARLNAATALAAAGEPDRALGELLAACRLAPYDPEPPARLAVFLASAGRHKDAALWFERAFRAEPLAAIAADAARAWSLAGEPARAEEWGRRAASFGAAGGQG
ncbi:MAG TPA: DUF2723 domain-containing protein [Candidatus Omnitrophota bacterium]|nr:DUF2723 domain-containing protein [Candidatus Omnitrophota bacterium]